MFVNIQGRCSIKLGPVPVVAKINQRLQSRRRQSVFTTTQESILSQGMIAQTSNPAGITRKGGGFTLEVWVPKYAMENTKAQRPKHGNNAGEGHEVTLDGGIDLMDEKMWTEVVTQAQRKKAAKGAPTQAGQKTKKKAMLRGNTTNKIGNSFSGFARPSY